MIFVGLLLLVSVYNTIFCSFRNNKNLENKAVVIVPVADVAGYALSQFDKSKSVEQLYNDLPLASGKDRSCPRIHQLLFNEIVTIQSELDHEVKCEFESLLYFNENLHKKGWILKKNIKKLQSIYPRKIDIEAIPAPYSDKNKKIYTKNIVTLAWPFYCETTNLYYSAGTRFVHVKEKDTKDSYAIFILDPHSLKKRVCFVSKKYALIKYPADPNASIKHFMKLLKKWVSKDQDIFPYVWGGASFINRVNTDDFKLVATKCPRFKKRDIWIRPKLFETPYTGCDCSTVILRIAQICGMPYFFKNSRAAAHNMKPLAPNQELEEGDLIWFPGHIQIVSDLNKNELIEAAGYNFGYGKLQSIALKNVFQSINTYQDLIDAYRAKKPLKRLNKKGDPVATISNLLLLKMKSIW